MMALIYAVFVLLLAGPAFGAASFDAVSSAHGQGIASLSWNHTTTGANTFMLCGGGVQDFVGGTTITGFTYNSAALTLKDNQGPDGEFRAIMYKRTAPTTGTNLVEITFSGVVNVGLGCMTFAGVDQSTPEGATVFDTDNSDGLSASITVPANGMGASFGVYNEAAASCTNSTSGQTERFQVCNNDFDVQGFGSTTTTAGVVAMTWTTAAADSGAMIAVPINEAAAPGGSAARRRVVVVE